MRKNLMFFALAAIGFASCNGGFKQGENGLLYNIYKDKGALKIKEGDFISFHIIVKNDGDSIIYNSYDAGQPQPMILSKPQFKGDLFDGLKLLGEGDSATVKVSADSIFKKGSVRPPSFKGSKYVVYDVKVEKVIPKGKLTDAVFQQTITAYISTQATALKAQEPVKLKKYIADNKLNVTKTDSGLYYVVNKPGTGPVAVAGDTVVVNYTGKLVSGKVFDSSIKADAIKGKIPGAESRTFEPIRFPVGQQRVIKGWDEGLVLLNKGAKATFVIPSALAYGEQGNREIPPSSPLIFDIELVNIIHPNPNAAKPATALPIPPQPAKK